MKKFFVAALCFALFAAGGGVSNELMRWYFTRPDSAGDAPGWDDSFDLAQYDAYYLGDTSQKDIFLTFDEGYENGYTSVILDVLKEKNVPAAFFVTKSYIRENPDLIRRMVDEGHVVGNHTVRHKSSPSLSPAELTSELTAVSEYFKEMIGTDIPPFFRPPMGEYSLQTLQTTKDAGYATIFWSFAYADWLVDKQPGAGVAHKKVVDGLHNGAILLLHAVSSSNAEAMGDIIDSARALGYEFKSLYQLTNPMWPPPLG
ncbi:MAG: polysaccharide deacetylase family protein [Defluviitaleaceae bacterium]|nr:polysaccharide deacetylase family protein [Defluviitaleaceae bacterium]